MSNHFHLVLKTPQANLVAGMQWFLGTFTARLNRRQRRFGHRFSVLEQIDVAQGVKPFGEQLREYEEQKGRCFIQQILRERGGSEAELLCRAKGDRGKVRRVLRLRGETTLTWSWIARQLAMGHWRTAANAVRRFTSQGTED